VVIRVPHSLAERTEEKKKRNEQKFTAINKNRLFISIGIKDDSISGSIYIDNPGCFRVEEKLGQVSEKKKSNTFLRSIYQPVHKNPSKRIDPEVRNGKRKMEVQNQNLKIERIYQLKP
jgi:hypothetical protein